MSVAIQQVANTNTFYFWKSQTNLMANAMSTVVVTTDTGPTSGNAAITGTFSANTVNANNVVVNGFATIKAVSANGTIGSSGQVLTSNGTSTYWSSAVGTVVSVSSGAGLTGGNITSSGTISLDVYTGTNSLNLIFPIGTVLPVYTGTETNISLGTQRTIRVENLQGALGTAGSEVLSGVWRNRGICGKEYRSPTDIHYYYLYQRVS